MKNKKLVEKFRKFIKDLEEHQELYSNSLDNTIPDCPVKNIEKLKLQQKELHKQLYILDSYINKFTKGRIMSQAATGIKWDAYRSAVGDDTAQIKGSSLNNVIMELEGIVAVLETKPLDEEIESNNFISSSQKKQEKKQEVIESDDILTLIKLLKTKDRNDLAVLLKDCVSEIEGLGQYGSYLHSILSIFWIYIPPEKLKEIEQISEEDKKLLLDLIRKIYPLKDNTPEVIEVNFRIFPEKGLKSFDVSAKKESICIPTEIINRLPDKDFKYLAEELNTASLGKAALGVELIAHILIRELLKWKYKKSTPQSVLSNPEISQDLSKQMKEVLVYFNGQKIIRDGLQHIKGTTTSETEALGTMRVIKRFLELILQKPKEKPRK